MVSNGVHCSLSVSEYAKKHCLCQAKDEFKADVDEDCDRMHHSATMAEFKSKATAVRQHWLQDGYVAAEAKRTIL